MLGVLSLADKGSAYAIPLFYGYDGDSLFFHSHIGHKDEFIEATEEACLVVMSYESEDAWESVQAFGPVEKLSVLDDIKDAEAALLDVPLPPEFGTFPAGKPRRSESGTYYWRLLPETVHGVRSEKGP